ncbi:hypothetical protein Nepgr_016522 [Nepenthes gracilis]|uniref:tRNA/rRNA methyltransferase SpoU type domain-containing protein n=1 Tax=Nepenthes gracilis TaxID=150966 RepID=A0AAD3SQH4_NEPGR|nr:hypothetical protein Nepgr_016522 [Nepenthes gracilis]
MHYPSASTAYPHPLLNKTSNCCKARLSIPHAVVRSLSSYDESKNCSSLPVSRTIDLPSRVKSLTSTSNPFVKHCLKLRQSSSYRHTHGSALIIGSTPIREIYKFHMLKQERQNTLVDCLFLLDGTDVPEGLDDGLVRIVHVSSTVMRRLSGVQSMESVEAIALMRIPSSFLNLNNSKLGGDCKGWFSCPHRILVLEGIQDPGNLGTLIRSAMAFKWDGIFLLPGCCDPFNEKVLRASRGASFQFPIISGNWVHLDAIGNKYHQIKILAGHPYSSNCSKRFSLLSQGLADSLEETPLFLILGSEGGGLSEKSMQACELVTIPMAELSNSLNAAVAGGIFLFMLRPRS